MKTLKTIFPLTIMIIFTIILSHTPTKQAKADGGWFKRAVYYVCEVDTCQETCSYYVASDCAWGGGWCTPVVCVGWPQQ